MKHKELLPRMIVLIVVSMVLVACSTPKAAPTQISPTNTPTAAQPTVAATAMSVDSVWKTKANMPTERWEHYPCVVDGKIYVIGGAGPVYNALRTVEVYDPATDTWATRSEMPTARQGLSTSVVNGKIYAIGGASSSSTSYASVETFSVVEEYDPATNTWTTKSPMPTERGWHSANVVDGKIYIIGGTRESSPGYTLRHVLTVEVYDPATDNWSQKGDMPVSRAAGSSSVVDGKIYLIGGYGGAQRVDEYDPSTDTWMEKSEMPTKRIGLSTSVLDGKIYAIGGFLKGLASHPGVTTVEVYNAATDTWTTAPDMPTGRYGAYTVVVDGKIYVFGGISGWPASAYGIVEVYDPEEE
jgi:N-acetylneuraminic acid mutarotase